MGGGDTDELGVACAGRSLCEVFLSRSPCRITAAICTGMNLLYTSEPRGRKYLFTRLSCLGIGPTKQNKQDPCQVVLSRESTCTGLV